MYISSLDRFLRFQPLLGIVYTDRFTFRDPLLRILDEGSQLRGRECFSHLGVILCLILKVLQGKKRLPAQTREGSNKLVQLLSETGSCVSAFQQAGIR